MTDLPGAAPQPAAATPPAPPAPATPVVRRLRLVVTASLAALVLLGLAWELWLAPIGRGTLALKVLPLLFAFVGVWRHRLYTYRWLSLLVWLYVLEGLTRAGSDRGISQLLAMLETLLAVLLFAACTLYIRRRLNLAPVTT